MSDKSTPPTGSFFALPGHRVLALEGRDAAKFAQAQFMGDVDALADGNWHWSGWLTPKGRVVALFALLRFDQERLWLLLPDADPGDLATRLQGFVFRTKVKLRTLDDVHATGAFAPPAAASGATFYGDPGNGVELDLGTPAGARTLRLSGTAAPADEAAAGRWDTFDLAHGWPRLLGDQVEKWTPQQLSLQRLRAYSVRKGCYPGQEIVARTHFLGQAKRGMVRLDTGQPASPGDAVMDGEREIGTLVSTARAEALAVMPLEHGDASPAVNGQACTSLPLLDGLAR